MMPWIDRELSRTLTYRQRYVLALVRTFSGSLSLFCSSIIIYKIYLRYQEHQSRNGGLRTSAGSTQCFNTYFRMILSVSILDVMHSFWTALSVLPTPKDFGGVFGYGTVATCSTQAFFSNATSGILLYMATLNTYFMLKIRYNIPDVVIEKRYEIWLHAIPICQWLVTGIVGLSLKVFGPIQLPELGCWLGSYPYGCFSTNSCTRGFRIVEYHDWYAWTFSYMWLFMCVIAVLVNSVLIYTAIRKQERRNDKYLAATLQKKETTVSSTKKLGSASQQFSASELPLPDFDFVDEIRGENPDSAFFVVNELLSSHMTLDNRENAKLSKIDEWSGDAHSTEENTLTPLDDPCTSTVWKEVVPAQENKESSPPSRNKMCHTNQRRIKQSRIAAVQSSCYIFSALFTAVWTFLPWVGYKLQVEAPVRFFFAYMANTVAPGQGILNLLIFVRLQYLHLRDTKKDWSRSQCFRHCLFSSA